MSEHIHEDSFFCGGAVGQKVNDFIIECFVRASQVISKEIVGCYIKGVSECNIRKCGHGTGYFREQKGKG